MPVASEHVSVPQRPRKDPSTMRPMSERFTGYFPTFSTSTVRVPAENVTDTMLHSVPSMVLRTFHLYSPARRRRADVETLWARSVPRTMTRRAKTTRPATADA